MLGFQHVHLGGHNSAHNSNTVENVWNLMPFWAARLASPEITGLWTSCLERSYISLTVKALGLGSLFSAAQSITSQALCVGSSCFPCLEWPSFHMSFKAWLEYNGLGVWLLVLPSRNKSLGLNQSFSLWVFLSSRIRVSICTMHLLATFRLLSHGRHW